MRKRRTSDQVLGNQIAQVYASISKLLTQKKDMESVLEQIFNELKPLRDLEQEYRSEKNDGNTRNNTEVGTEN